MKNGGRNGESDPEGDAHAESPLQQAVRDGAGGGGVVATEVFGDEGLSGHCQGIHDEGEEEPELVGDLVGGDGRHADARRHGGCEPHRTHERGRSEKQVAPDREKGGERAQARDFQLNPELFAPPPQEEADEQERADPLGDGGGGGRSGNPPARPEDEDRVEGYVHDVEADGNPHRRAGVLISAEGAVAGRDEQKGRPRQGADAEVGEGRSHHLPGSPH